MGKLKEFSQHSQARRFIPGSITEAIQAHNKANKQISNCKYKQISNYNYNVNVNKYEVMFKEEQ